MSAVARLLVFRLGKQRYAVPLDAIQRIVAAVEITFLPEAPDVVMGLINVAGSVMPVLSLRRRFGLPQAEITPADQFLIARTSRRTVALVVDEALAVMECATTAITETAQVVTGVEQIRGVLKLPDGLLLIHDLEKFLSASENVALSAALGREGGS